MCCDAERACPEDGVYATETFECAATRVSFVTLHQVATVGRGISQLRTRARENRLRNQRVTLTNEAMICRVAVLRERAESQAAVALSDLRELETIDVEQVWATGDKFCVWLQDRLNGELLVRRVCVSERLHTKPFWSDRVDVTSRNRRLFN